MNVEEMEMCNTVQSYIPKYNGDSAHQNNGLIWNNDYYVLTFSLYMWV